MRQIKRRQRNSSARVCRRRIQFLRAQKLVAKVLFVVAAMSCLNTGVSQAHTPHDHVEHIVISPEFIQDQTLFIVVRQNLFRSVDGGGKWQRLVRGINNKHEFSSLAISRQRKDLLLLATHGDGIYSSRDGGNSWAKANAGLTSHDIRLISMSPSSSSFALAVDDENRLYRTNNGGEIWELIFRSPDQLSAIEFISGEQEHIIAGDVRGTLYQSRDQGETWNKLATLEGAGEIRSIAASSGISSERAIFVGTEAAGVFKTVDGGASFEFANDGLTDRSIKSVVVSPSPAAGPVVFVSTWNDGIFFSDNGGKSWQSRGTGLTKDHQADVLQLPHFEDLRISSSFDRDRTIFVGAFDGLFKSEDGGDTWREMDVLPSNIIVGLAISPDYENDSSVAVSQYFGGAYLSRDKGASWSGVSKSPKGRCDPRFFQRFRIFEVVFSPDYRSDRTLFTSTWWGVLRAAAGGKSWNGVSIQHWSKRPLALPQIAISPGFAIDRTMYLGTRHGEFFRSTDGGKSFEFVTDVGDGIRSLVVPPDSSSGQTLFAVWDGGIKKTSDGGLTWTSADRGISLKRRADIKLVISPNYRSDRTMFAGTADGIFVTADGGQNWTRIEAAAIGGRAYIRAIAISPSYPADRTLIVNVKGRGLFKSENAGETFAPVGVELLEGNISLSGTNPFSEQHQPIQFSPHYAKDHTIYGISGLNLFRSEDGGLTWKGFTPPEPAYDISTFVHCSVAESRKRRYITASAAGLLGYFVFGLLMSRRISFRANWLSRGIAGAAIFGIVLASLSI